MAVGSKKEFIEVLKASQLFDSEELAEILEKHEADDPKLLAGKLAQDGTLTRWQAKMIYAGYSKLKLGNFVLLDRISRDDLGDRFNATHKSLDRKVEIQVLPKRISDDPQLQSFFVSNIGLVSELDHPHITHIHDVDRAGGQFFLVDEAQKGASLDQVELTANGLLLCCNQILQALAYAHSQGVVHGEVNLENIVYAGESHFKIRGISLSLVRRKLAGGDDPTARDDHIALAKLLRRRFKKLESAQREEFGWLGKQLSHLKENPITEYPRVLAATERKLESWGENHPPITREELENNPLERIDDSKEFAVSANSVSNSPDDEQHDSSIPTDTDPQSQSNSPLDDDAPTGALRTPLLIAGTVACLVLLILGGLYASGVFSSNTPTAQKEDEKSVRPTTPAVNTQTTQKPSVKNPDSLPKPTTDEDDKPKDQTTPKEEDKDPNSTAAPDSGTDQQESATPNVNTESPDGATKDVDPKPDSIVKANPEQEEPTAPEEPKKPTPLEQMPSMVDLPVSESKDSFVIGQLGENDKLTSLELISDSSVFSNGKGDFAIKNVDETTWEVQLLSKPNGDGDTVARIDVVNQELRFTWHEDVSKKSKANAIRNGILKLGAGGSFKEIVLREPVSVDLQLTAEDYSSRINTDAIWLPQAKSIRVEVKKPSAPWPKLYLGSGTAFPETFAFDDDRTPLIILFSSNPDQQFVSVVLNPTINRKLSFEVEVFARGKNTDAIQYKSAKTAEQTIELLQKARESQSIARQQANAALERARQIRNGTIGKREEDVRAARKAYEEIDTNVEIAENIRDQLGKLHDSPLQFTVFYELDGRRIVLAQSNSPADQ